MALQRDTKYPGRFTTATTAHPQGLFKNRTTSTSQDGSYLEKDWLNDWDGFFGSLLSKAGLTPNGNVDAVGASQYFNALQTVTVGNYVTAGGTANVITLADTSVTSYVDGMSLRFKVSLANTGATTLNVNSVGAVAVYGSAGLTCQGGELAPGLATVVYSSTLGGFVVVHCTGANKQVPDGTQSHHAVSKSQLDTVKQLLYVEVSLAGGAMTWTLPKQTLRFRNPNLTTGALVEHTLSANLTLTIPQGATLGTASSLLANLIPVILYNSGNPVIGVVNLAGGLDLSEAGLLSATAISTSATSASVAYSSVAVTNSPYIVAGLVQSTQASAGTWATAPNVIPKSTNLAGMIGGVGFYPPVVVTASRTFNTTYYNTTGRPKKVKVVAMLFTVTGFILDLTVNGVIVDSNGFGGSSTSVTRYFSVEWTVPPGGSYLVSWETSTPTIVEWIEA